MSGHPDHPLLRVLRQAVAATVRGEYARISLPFADAQGSLTIGPDQDTTCPRPVHGPAVRVTVRASALRADEDWILGLVFGDDAVEGEDGDHIRLTWSLGPAHLQIAQAAAAYSLAALVGERSAAPPGDGTAGFMRWLAGRLDESRLGESVALDGSMPLVVLGALDSGPLPYLVSPLGRGVHALPANAVARAYAEDSPAFLGVPIVAATSRPRGTALRWRDRQGRTCYVLESALTRVLPLDLGPFRPPHPQSDR